MTTPLSKPPAKANGTVPKLVYAGIGLLFVAIIIFVVHKWGGSLFEFFRDPDKARDFINSFGPFGPLVFVLLQALQVMIVPIPGQVTGFLSGYLFGTFLGTLYGMAGIALGCTIVFTLARKLGRPFVERFVSPEHLKKFDYIAETKGIVVLFLLFLIPALPNDLISYLAGLTRIKIAHLVVIAVLGQLPGIATLSFVGSGVATDNVKGAAIAVGASTILLAILVWQRKKIERIIKKLAKKHT